MESILITGGAGFIGSNIAEALLKRGCRVVVLDDLSTGRMENISALQTNENFRFVRGSVLDADLLRSVITTEAITRISHQAAVPSVAKSVKDPEKTLSVNVTGTGNVFHTAAACGCKRVVFASSSSVYGDTPVLPKQESMLLNPKSPYAVSKAAKEMLASVFSKLHNLEIAGLRYFNVYGRKQNPDSDYAAVIPKFINKALRNEVIPIEGDGLQTRDFTYIDDVIQANINALTKDGAPNGVYNVAYGSRISVLDLAQLIRDITGSTSEIAYNSARRGDVRDSLADIALAKKDLGYAPRFDIKQGLHQTIAWYREHLN